LYSILYSFRLTDTTQSATATNVQLLRADGNQLRCRPLEWLAICSGSMVTRFRAAIAKPRKMAIRSTLTQAIGRVLLRTILQLSMLYMGRTLGHEQSSACAQDERITFVLISNLQNILSLSTSSPPCSFQ
jgi:hypothetical protein